VKKYGSNKINVNNDSDSSGNNVRISVNTQKQRQQAFRSGSTTIKVNGSAPILKTNKLNNSSIIFLGDCEMPITKSSGIEHNNKSNSASDANANKNSNAENGGKFTQKIQINSSASNNGELKQQFAASSQQIR
jgi:hypothetical protein